MILVPELVCLESLQEWLQARKLIRQTAESTRNELQYIHAYYLGMMGVRYRTPVGWSVLWPNQYAWLLREKLVDWEDRAAWGLETKMIRDKNKADGLVKLATIWQVVWFTVQCITRSANKVPLAPLETMTLAYVVVALLTYVFWWKKPKDIATPSFIDLPLMNELEWATFKALSMEDTYDMDETKPKPSKNIAWYLIARDYAAENVTRLVAGENLYLKSSADSNPGSLDSDIEAAKLCRAIPLPEAMQEQGSASSNSRVVTEWDATLYMSKWWPLICLLTAAFGALHLISWNSRFPTLFELWLWRISAIVSVVTSILSIQFRTVTLKWEGLLTIVSIGSPLLYFISRVVMTGEVFAALRAMPVETYDSSVIWNYWFHFS